MRLQGLFSLPDPGGWDGLVKWFRASFVHHRVFRASVVSIFAARPEVAWMGGEQARPDGKGGPGTGLQVAGAKTQTQVLAVGCPWLVSAMVLRRIGVVGERGWRSSGGKWMRRNGEPQLGLVCKVV